MTDVLSGLLIPFAGTTLGAACVLFVKKEMNVILQRALTGFAAGVMVAASVWSLLLPALSQASGMGRWSFVPAVVGFWAGIMFLFCWIILFRICIQTLSRRRDRGQI